MILIYNDYGSQERINDFVFLFNKVLQNGSNVAYIDAKGVIEGSWTSSCELFIMPGGFDLGYKKKLNGAGNLIIKKYVENGGKYLGICAGAYYACSQVVFNHPENNVFSSRYATIDEKRELAFFEGKAIGPVFEYDYNNYSKAWLLDIDSPDFGTVRLLYNGGPYFEKSSQDFALKKEYNIIGSYNNLPMIVQCDYGSGKCVLSSLHFEHDYRNNIEIEDIYLNQIFEELKKNDDERIRFAKYLLNLLNLDIML